MTITAAIAIYATFYGLSTATLFSVWFGTLSLVFYYPSTTHPAASTCIASSSAASPSTVTIYSQFHRLVRTNRVIIFIQHRIINYTETAVMQMTAETTPYLAQG